MRELTLHELSGVAGGEAMGAAAGLDARHIVAGSVGAGAATVGYVAGSALIGWVDPAGTVKALAWGAAGTLILDWQLSRSNSAGLGTRAGITAFFGCVGGLAGSIWSHEDRIIMTHFVMPRQGGAPRLGG